MSETFRHWLRLAALLVISNLVAHAVSAAEEPAGDAAKKPLVERLGFAPGTKVLILNGDDFGMNHSDTVATIDAMKSGGLTSATIMVPCPWFPAVVDFAKQNPQANLGIHVTLTSEWKHYKWGPVLGRTAVPSLVDNLGYFYSNIQPIYAKSKLEEVEAETRAQIDRAIEAGIDVTHIDSHMGTLQYNPKYHEVYIKIAKSYNLPCRIAGKDLMEPRGGMYLIEMADKMGVLHPDWLYNDGPKKVEETESFWLKRFKEIQAGMVSEIYIHAGLLTSEMQATTGTWQQRTADSEFFSRDSTKEFIKNQGIELISYRELRELQRTGKPIPRVKSYGW